jgi:hypothetical protein
MARTFRSLVAPDQLSASRILLLLLQKTRRENEA